MPADHELPASFYELVGRITLEASLLEERLVELAIKADMATLPYGANFQDEYEKARATHGGKPGTALVEAIRPVALPRIAPLDQAAFEAYLNEVKDALNTRHEIVHSVWLGPDDPARVAFRHLPKNRRDASGNPSKTITQSDQDLQAVLDTLTRLVQQLEVWRNRIH